MVPRRWRLIRWVTGFVIVLFILGCMAAIANITQVVDFEGQLSMFEPFEGKEPKPYVKRRGKFLDTDFFLGTKIPNIEENQKLPFEGEEPKLHIKRRGKFLDTDFLLRTKIPNIEENRKLPTEAKVEKIPLQQEKEVQIVRENLHNATDRKLGLRRKVEKKPKASSVGRLSYLNEALMKDTREWQDIPPNYNLHAFYYPWYGNPDNDDGFLHWNHEYLPHWNKKMAKKWPTGVHEPPDDIGSNFYPQLGCYSSSDEVIIAEHMKQMRFAGIGVLALSWYPPAQSDGQGKPTDKLVKKIMDIAHEHHIKVAFHSEPYEDRNEFTFSEDVKYIIDTYGDHPALYKHPGKNKKEFPLFYLYDSYLVNATSWATIFRRGSPASLRGTKYDGIFLGLFVDKEHRSEILRGAFDGFYTYFSSSGFTYGSTWTSWKILKQFAAQNNMLFVPSVGPGYVDTRVRPWNGINTKKRDNGGYYDGSFRAALATRPQIISITSYNEWHEGTQIETAIPYSYGNFTYEDYSPNQPDYYLKLTRQLGEHFKPSA